MTNEQWDDFVHIAVITSSRLFLESGASSLDTWYGRIYRVGGFAVAEIDGDKVYGTTGLTQGEQVKNVGR